MSDLLRQTVDGQTSRPRPQAIPIVGIDERGPPSDSSSSSADSSASVNTVRPSSAGQPAPSTHWTRYFAQELYLDSHEGSQRAVYHAYFTPPSNPAKGPLFICHHGAGSTGMSFAIFTRELLSQLPAAGILSLEARGHGSIVAGADGIQEIVDFSIDTLSSDAFKTIELTQERMGWQTLPPTVLVGHSLGGAVVTDLAAKFALGSALVGFCVIDVVEGSAIEALSLMKTYLSSRPSVFTSVDEAIEWHRRSRTIRDLESAKASVPALLTQLSPGRFVWKTDLNATAPWWEGWFSGMSQKFLKGRGAKMLILAGTDRLDKDLMVGQMQGKFQLVVLPEAGHFVQEDLPGKTASLLAEFFKRNDRSSMVLPPKVSELLAQGKKV